MNFQTKNIKSLGGGYDHLKNIQNQSPTTLIPFNEL